MTYTPPDPDIRADAVSTLAEASRIEGPDGQFYMRDAKGALMPLHLVRPTDKLEDQLVRGMMGYAVDLHDQLARFKRHCYADVEAYLQLLAEKYDAAKGGKKGNMTLTSYDGTFKVQIAVAERITFGPELQIAKGLIDDCINDWAEGARQELRALVSEAFRTDKEGEVSREAVFRLMRVEITDARWQQAMTAIRDSIRVAGSKSYIRFYRRDTPEAEWQAVPIDLAAV